MLIWEMYEELIKLSPLERIMKEYFLKNGTNCNNDYIREQCEAHRDDYFSFLKTKNEIPFEKNHFKLSENSFIEVDEDVSILKHLRYWLPEHHNHTFFELIYVFTGSCVNWIDDNELLLKEGDLCIIPPGVVHSLGVNRDDCLIINILVRASTFDERFTSMMRADDILSAFYDRTLYTDSYLKYLLFHTGEDKLLKELILRMFEAGTHKSQKYHNRIINGYFEVFTGTFLARYEKSVEYPEDYFNKFNIVPQVLSWMKWNYKQITLRDCAVKMNLSERYLAGKIKKETGFTFPQLLTRTRMNIAKNLLKERSMPIDEIAERVGYNDAPYFFHVFKKYSGITPTEFRNMTNE